MAETCRPEAHIPSDSDLAALQAFAAALRALDRSCAAFGETLRAPNAGSGQERLLDAIDRQRAVIRSLLTAIDHAAEDREDE
jgi:hypothetical protein